MNLLQLVHTVGEGETTVLGLAGQIVDAIDNDSSVPIDEWDMTGLLTYEGESTAGENEIVKEVAIVVNEWGYIVGAITESGSVARWKVLLTISGSPYEALHSEASIEEVLETYGYDSDDFSDFVIQVQDGDDWINHATYHDTRGDDVVGPETRAIRHAKYWSEQQPERAWRVCRLDPVWTHDPDRG